MVCRTRYARTSGPVPPGHEAEVSNDLDRQTVPHASADGGCHAHAAVQCRTLAARPVVHAECQRRNAAPTHEGDWDAPPVSITTPCKLKLKLGVHWLDTQGSMGLSCKLLPRGDPILRPPGCGLRRCHCLQRSTVQTPPWVLRTCVINVSEVHNGPVLGKRSL